MIHSRVRGLYGVWGVVEECALSRPFLDDTRAGTASRGQLNSQAMWSAARPNTRLVVGRCPITTPAPTAGAPARWRTR